MGLRWGEVLGSALFLLWAARGPAWGVQEFPVPPPPLSPDLYPCAENCHNGQETNRTPRVLEGEHTDIVLHHAEQLRWCLDCHDAGNRDKLHLQNGDLIDFSQSYMLCGQCHGDRYRDWRRGIHGKRSGLWNGAKQYQLCASCHNPHSPRILPIRPEPPPEVPGARTLPSHSRSLEGERRTEGKKE